MDANVRRRLYLVAALLIAVGLLAGTIVPLSSQGTNCGSAFFDRTRTDTAVELRELGEAYGVDPTPHDCDGVRSMWRTVYIALMVGGGVLLVAGWVAAGAGRPRREDA